MYYRVWALGRALGSKGDIKMDRHQEISEVIERARQQRAEYIASAFRRHALPIAVVAALSLMLLQFTGGQLTDDGTATEVAQVLSQPG